MYGKVGLQDLAEGISAPVRLNPQGNLVVSAYGGKYAEAAMAGRLFFAANINMVATSTTLDTAFVGLGLCNPAGSGKVVIVHEFGYAVVVEPAAAAVIALAITDDTGFADDTNAPIHCAREGYATSVCYTDEGGTITAPVLIKVISQIGDLPTTAMAPYNQLVDLGGSIILDPGRAVVTDTTTVMGASAAQFSFMWEEIDD